MDSAALREQLEARHGECFAWALSCCGRDTAAAEEVLQTAYLKVLDGRARFEGRSSFGTWLFAVIKHTAVDQRRRALLRSLWILPLGNGVEPPSMGPGPDEQVERSERRQRLERALTQLPQRQREVLLLVFYHGHTIEAAAQVLDIGTGSARTHYTRGKTRLRSLLGNEGWMT